MSNILEVNNLTVRFGGLTAVNEVTLNQEEGEILSLIGPNGAGKTTLFNLLTGVYQPTGGTIFFNGENITGKKAYERGRLGLARTFQNIRLFKNMTVLENVLAAHRDCNTEGVWDAFFMGKRLKEKRKRVVEECEEILGIVGLSDEEDTLSVNLPYGKQRILEIARTLALKPGLILLDEPGAGMNSSEKDELSEVIRYVTRKMKINILLIEHDMRFVMGISDRIIVLNHGEIIAGGLPEEIQKDSGVIEAYLGSGITALDGKGEKDDTGFGNQ